MLQKKQINKLLNSLNAVEFNVNAIFKLNTKQKSWKTKIERLKLVQIESDLI